MLLSNFKKQNQEKYGLYYNSKMKMEILIVINKIISKLEFSYI